MRETHISRSEEETALIARNLAARVQPGMIITLQGDLGAGKSVFARALGRALGIEEPMPSPTFSLVHEYQGRLPLLHIDLYRLSGEEEFEMLGLDEVMEQSVTLVEWPERAPSLVKEAALRVTIALPPPADPCRDRSVPDPPPHDQTRTITVE
ncbi:tRNA (adenosine(37)-N6)-threonylcarbamoyltransferase complex ATPase subunit type 1 TsaE [Alkalispirochaeta sphaeroplastigenens]|uniref:tRNA (adenosine(37)-N6)-threonylcarbamoyltransferase complex ATPase subunit type 1 TsaE n=1 Tax=Alkalispirochaeta sphaeroplastigenens TaxID=1187066 RepID=UPI000CDA46FF|nr:tRNA (adenosine(37)-N6)-threonylcarbamoyltransferase complex ATPase subunit type 1 TsaE [Alkalispirochaeta sphaeroplastigenens]